ncbi:MAG: FeoB small GTPase domain-containing protein [Christensenellales bacterium]
MNKIILVGNPNTGKTTLFNKIANAKEKTANYSGVTVSAIEKEINLLGSAVTLVDLPGMYSVQTTSEDEKVALDYLVNQNESLICFVATSVTLAKNLYLLSELKLQGKQVCLFINNNGVKLDTNLLKKIEDKLKINIFFGDARKNRKEILKFFERCLSNSTKNCLWNFNYDELVKLFNPPPIKINNLDKLLLHKFWGRIIFFSVILLVFFVSFGSIGGYLSYLIEIAINLFGTYFCGLLQSAGLNIMSSFIDVVIIKSLGSILCFIPQLVLLLLQLYLLEDIGYLPRVAYLFNIELNSIHLNGKSIFSMVVGIGCTTSAYIVTRNISHTNCRKATARFLPFIGCSAKVPIILYLITYFNEQIHFIYIILIYLLLILFGIALLKLRSKPTQENFILELPKLKVPSLWASIKYGFNLTVEFLKRVAGVLFLVSSILWLLSNLTYNFKFVLNNPQNSLLYLIANKLTFLFYPMGLDNESIVIAIIAGLIAKENIISTANLFGGFCDISGISLIAFIMFVLFYPPCIPALRNCKQEFGKALMIETILVHFGLAYCISVVFYTFSKFLNIWAGFAFCFLLVFLIFAYVKVKKFSVDKNICLNCKKLYKSKSN